MRINEATRIVLIGTPLLFVGLFASAVATASPQLPTAGSESASATIADLQSQSYDVSVNFPQGNPNVPLSECRVISINNPSSPTAVPSSVTVYVDVLCPNAK